MLHLAIAPTHIHPQGGFPLTQIVYQAVLQESIPAQIRQHILYISNDKGLADEFVRELTVTKRLYKHFLWDKIALEIEARMRELVEKQDRGGKVAHVPLPFYWLSRWTSVCIISRIGGPAE